MSKVTTLCTFCISLFDIMLPTRFLYLNINYILHIFLGGVLNGKLESNEMEDLCKKDCLIINRNKTILKKKTFSRINKMKLKKYGFLMNCKKDT